MLEEREGREKGREEGRGRMFLTVRVRVHEILKWEINLNKGLTISGSSR